MFQGILAFIPGGLFLQGWGTDFTGTIAAPAFPASVTYSRGGLPGPIFGPQQFVEIPDELLDELDGYIPEDFESLIPSLPGTETEAFPTALASKAITALRYAQAIHDILNVLPQGDPSIPAKVSPMPLLPRFGKTVSHRLLLGTIGQFVSEATANSKKH